MLQLDAASREQHEVLLSRHSVASLWVCSVQRALLGGERRSRESVHSAGHTAVKPSVKEYKTVFPSTCHLLTVWSYKYEHRSSENIKCPFYVVICFSLLLKRRLCAAKTTA